MNDKIFFTIFSLLFVYFTALYVTFILYQLNKLFSFFSSLQLCLPACLRFQITISADDLLESRSFLCTELILICLEFIERTGKFPPRCSSHSFYNFLFIHFTTVSYFFFEHRARRRKVCADFTTNFQRMNFTVEAVKFEFYLQVSVVVRSAQSLTHLRLFFVIPRPPHNDASD